MRKLILIATVLFVVIVIVALNVLDNGCGTSKYTSWRNQQQKINELSARLEAVEYKIGEGAGGGCLTAKGRRLITSGTNTLRPIKKPEGK